MADFATTRESFMENVKRVHFPVTLWRTLAHYHQQILNTVDDMTVVEQSQPDNLHQDITHPDKPLPNIPHLGHYPPEYFRPSRTANSRLINSLWPSDTIWRQRSGSTLTQVMAWCQAITWTNVDWSSAKSSDSHIRAISQQIPQPSITKICLKIACLKFHWNFPANELTKFPAVFVKEMRILWCED